MVCPTPLPAQSLPPLRLFNPVEQGGQRQTWDVAQAPDGTMAFANGAGLLLFDGVRWRLIAVPGGQTLRSVTYYPPENAWLAGGYDAWWRFPFTVLTLDSLPAPTRIAPPPGPREEWWHVQPDPLDSSVLYWQTFSRMARYTAGQTVAPLPTPSNLLYAREVRDTLFVPQLPRGLAYLQPARSAQLAGADSLWQPYPRHAGSSLTELDEAVVVGLAPGPGGQLLVASQTSGVLSVTASGASPWPSAAQQPWSNDQLNNFIALRTGGYALGTASGGLYLLTNEGTVAAHLTADSGLSDNAVISLFEDSAGDLWLGLDDGIAHLELSSGVTLVGTDLGAVSAMALINERLLFGTNRGLYQLDGGNAVPLGQFSGQVWHITATPWGTVVGNNTGTFSFDNASGEAQRISQAAGGWCWLQLDSTHALAGTYVGVESFAVVDKRWVSTGIITGYSAPVQHLTQVSPTEFVAVHPQEGRVHLTIEEGSFTLVKPAPHDSTTATPRTSSSTEMQVGDMGIILSNTGLTMRLPNADSLQFPLRPNQEYPTAVSLGPNRIAVGLSRGLALINTNNSRATPSPALHASVQATDRRYTVSLTQANFREAPEFSVRLKGIDERWSDWSTVGTYVYPYLPSGQYEFVYRSADGQSGQLSWRVAARWYETGWAYLAYTFAVIGVLYGLNFYYRRRLARQARAANLQRQRELQAERLRTRAAALESEVEVGKREVALREAENKLQSQAIEQRDSELARSSLTIALRDAEVQLQSQALEQRDGELARSTLALARQNETLLQIKEQLTPLPKSGAVGKARRQLSRLIDERLDGEEGWANFEEHFDAVHAGFLKRLHADHPDLTPGDLRLAALLRINLPSKEIAPLLHISLRGVENKRYRLRKKLGLAAEVNLTEWVMGY